MTPKQEKFYLFMNKVGLYTWSAIGLVFVIALPSIVIYRLVSGK